MKYTLIFADGTELSNVTLSNNVFVCPIEVTKEMLNDEALKIVRIVPDEGEETILQYAKTDIVYHEQDGYHFVLVGADKDEIELQQLKAENDMLTECILEMSEIIYAE